MRHNDHGATHLSTKIDILHDRLDNEYRVFSAGSVKKWSKFGLNTLAGGFEKGRLSFDPGVVLKSGAKLVREWRGHTHTVLVIEDGFEYEGRRYRSLTMIAARITGAHWSGPRFFGVTKRTSRSLSATAGPGHE
jgi:hypothetical protein